ncbi:LLM class flavin-dependent oxidoreductase [Rhizobium leguminosarum]|uniref:LLM class flavin-dependent oxidoreductase n=1 Tax=Rhizobium leguminosarum TaxID=384 RepID=UPI001C989CC6|nr:LLM class flavin-dependent oxidoreductase [Rhizobium leguminosarum]MBY5337510.1 LLM class flavin-dependent oxidoreductase [Rhizobium leguminosarum]
MEIGIDSFAMLLNDPATGRLQSAVDRMESVLAEVELADQVGLDVFGMGVPLVELYRRAWLAAGHPSEEQRVGVHALGFVGETDKAAREAFFPGWLQMFTDAGRERGWPPPTQAQFDFMCGPDGAFLVGSPQTVAAKIKHVNRTLGGVSRLTFQMSTAALETEAMRRSIELLGTDVTPIIRGHRLG